MEKYFQFSPNIYAALHRDTLIILDSFRDEYLSFGKEETVFFQVIMEGPFQQVGDEYLQDGGASGSSYEKSRLSSFISYLLKTEIIKSCAKEQRKNKIGVAKKQFGLSQKEWLLPPSSKVKITTTLIAYACLIQAHSILNKGKLPALLETLKRNGARNRHWNFQSIERSTELSHALVHASKFYRKKSWCLAFAGALALLHCRYRYPCDLVIGVQTMPFLAHAWVETADIVLHDNHELQTSLSVILRVKAHAESGVK